MSDSSKVVAVCDTVGELCDILRMFTPEAPFAVPVAVHYDIDLVNGSKIRLTTES